MCTEDSIRVIDPEFATYGPMGFDLSMMLANLVMAFIVSQRIENQKIFFPIRAGY